MSFIKPDGAEAPPDMLIFEPEAQGHAFEWLAHLINTAAADEAWHVRFVVAGQLSRSLVAQIPPLAKGRIQILALQRHEEDLCNHRHLTMSAFARWWIMRRYLRRTRAKIAFFLSIDHLSLPLAIGLRCGGAVISGVLFRPSVHYRMIGPYLPSLPESVRDIRKSILYRLMLANRAVASVLSLDPYFADFAGAQYRWGAKVHAIVDPTFPSIESSEQDRELARQLPLGRIRFVLFGSLQRRKGVLELLDALSLLDSKLGRRVAVMIAGRVDGEVRERLMAGARRLAVMRPDIWLQVVDRRLASGEIAALVETCDVVLAPYQRFVGSSGVLLWAARAGKPVLTQHFGLIGRLVRDHALGLVADVTDAKALATALAVMIRDGPTQHFDRQSAARFAANRTPQAFASTVRASGDVGRAVGAAVNR
jgi:glycosyltransferase involved in cell wall biosynthesis